MAHDHNPIHRVGSKRELEIRQRLARHVWFGVVAKSMILLPRAYLATGYEQLNFDVSTSFWRTKGQFCQPIPKTL